LSGDPAMKSPELDQVTTAQQRCVPRQPAPIEPTSTVLSARIMMRVVWALMLREILTRYGRHNIGFLWLFVEPMMFTLGITGLWTFMGLGHGSNLPISAFALTGYSTVLLWRNMPGRAVMAISANLSLLYHRNVRPMDIFLARLMLEAASVTISFFTLAIIFTYAGWMEPPENVPKLVTAWLLTTWFGMALGLLLGSIAERSELIEKLWHPVSYLLFPLSGAAFLVEILPPAFQRTVLWLPMVHCTEFVREAFFGSKITAHYDLAYLCECNLIMTVFGLALERKLSREVATE